MPANNQKPASYSPASPRNTAKYTNKDGSKFITVPKGTPSESSLPSTPTTSKPSAPPPEPSLVKDPAPIVNRKKQKRRQKAAAKAAAEQAANGFADTSSSSSRPRPADYEIVVSDDEHEYVLASELEPQSNGHAHESLEGKKKNKKKKKKNVASNSDTASPMMATSNPQLQSSAKSAGSSGMSRDKIWSTSNQEERERIKEFWLGLGEDERKSLVKVEKDAVLKKMKEQQKHTCSCTVCGRKRTAIEEELEGLYDAYYLELEQFANQGEGPPMLPPPRDFSSLRPPRGIPSSYTNPPPARGRIVEHVGDDEDEDELVEEGYSDDEVEDDEYSDDEPPDEFQSPHDRDVTDFLTFGNSLQVKGGILTVADDLLKNDGKRFIEMMEQLAERRMAREEDAREHFSRGYGHPNGSYSNSHGHPPAEEDEYEDEEDEEEDYDDSQDEEYEDEEDQMTEEQRMEEGRRMFQIFAARMFEQRVLSAYKEKVAKERQEKLLQELEEESRQVVEQRAKKAKNAQKKKEKAAQKKQALAEERARKESELAAAEAARLEAERRRIADQKEKAELKKKQKEAAKKAEEEARLKKEAEKQKRLQEQREKQAEQERKAREAKEREKKLKEEQRQRENDAREQKEREARERKEKQERDKREKEARAAKALKEAQAAKEAKERAKEEKAAALKAASQAAQGQGQGPAQAQAQAQALQLPKRGQPQQPSQQQPPPLQQYPVSIPTALPQHPPNPATYASPKIPVATPVIPKAPTPIRPRTTSQQQDGQLSSSTSQSATSQNPSPHSMTPAHMSPGPIGLQRKSSTSTTATTSAHSYSTSPTNGMAKLSGQSAAFQMPPSMMQPPPGLGHHPPPGLANRMGQDPNFAPGFRPGSSMMASPPGINVPPATRGFPPVSMPPPGFSQAPDHYGVTSPFALPKEGPPISHTRQSSGAFDGPSSQPIGRPTPIGRPASLSFGRSHDTAEDETKHLGSRALLDDAEPLDDDSFNAGTLRGTRAPGPRTGFAASPFAEPGFTLPMPQSPWTPSIPIPAAGTHPFPPPGFNNPGWGQSSVPPGFGSPVPSMISARSTPPRQILVRKCMCQAVQSLVMMADGDGFVNLSDIKAAVETLSGDQGFDERDLIILCETEGNATNGGGSFDVRTNNNGSYSIRWIPDPSDGFNSQLRAVGAPGEIGSPLIGHSSVRGL